MASISRDYMILLPSWWSQPLRTAIPISSVEPFDRYVLQDIHTRKIRGKVHVARLKPYFPREVPDHLRRSGVRRVRGKCEVLGAGACLYAHRPCVELLYRSYSELLR